MSELLIQKLEERDHLSEDEKRVIRALPTAEAMYGAGEDLARYGERPTMSNLLLEGFVCRYHEMSDGGRQILAIHVPGDFVDLQSFPLKVMDHSLGALTRCRIAQVPHHALQRVTETEPHLTRQLWLGTMIDASLHREWLTNVGRRAAVPRTAHLFCELFIRMRIVGLTQDMSYHLPLTQTVLADSLGMSVVHTNRVIQNLRATGLMSWDGERVAILDWDGLRSLAEFDPTYLHLENVPR